MLLVAGHSSDYHRDVARVMMLAPVHEDLAGNAAAKARRPANLTQDFQRPRRHEAAAFLNRPNNVRHRWRWAAALFTEGVPTTIGQYPAHENWGEKPLEYPHGIFHRSR
jgi:hypothetical protein